MVADRSKHIRFPDDDLFRKVRVLALVNGEPVGATLARLVRGAVEAEFSQLPEAAQRRGRHVRLPQGRPRKQESQS